MRCTPCALNATDWTTGAYAALYILVKDVSQKATVMVSAPFAWNDIMGCLVLINPLLSRKIAETPCGGRVSIRKGAVVETVSDSLPSLAINLTLYRVSIVPRSAFASHIQVLHAYAALLFVGMVHGPAVDACHAAPSEYSRLRVTTALSLSRIRMGIAILPLPS